MYIYLYIHTYGMYFYSYAYGDRCMYVYIDRCLYITDFASVTGAANVSSVRSNRKYQKN